MKEKIKVAIYGLGGIGKELVRDFSEREDIEIAGVICRNPKQIGRDIGILSDMERELGVIVTANQTKEQDLYEAVKIDVLIHCAGANNAAGTFEQIRTALEHGINVITANVGTTDLWSSDPELAKEADEICKRKQVTYVGMGSSQVLERAVLMMTEGSKDIEKVSFMHHSDVHAYSEKSNRETLGIGLTIEEFEERKKAAKSNSAELNSNEDSVRFMGDNLGWKIDQIITNMEAMVNEENIVYGTQETLIGYEKGKERVREDWIFVLDPEGRYYDKIVLHGTPEVEAVMNYSPDRGFCTTYATIRNAIPVILKEKPGYISSLALPACGWYGGDYRDKL